MHITKLPVLERFLNSSEASDQVEAFVIVMNDLVEQGCSPRDLPPKLNEALGAVRILTYLLNGGNGFVNIAENGGGDHVSLERAVKILAEMGFTSVVTHLSPYAKRFDLAKGDPSSLDPLWSEFSKVDREGLEADPVLSRHETDSVLAAYLRKSVSHEALLDEAYRARLTALGGAADAIHATHMAALRGLRTVPSVLATRYVRQTGLRLTTAPKAKNYMVKDHRGVFSGVGQSVVIRHSAGAEKISLEILRLSMVRIEQVDPGSGVVLAQRHSFWLPVRPQWLMALIMSVKVKQFRA